MVVQTNQERVQKILSRWGVASRRQAEQMILAGRVRLNGDIVHLGQKADPQVDLLEVDGQSLESVSPPQEVYLLLNKPAGVVSTCRDTHNRPTVIDLLPPKLRQGQGIHPVGRLDAASTGALLLTNNGQLTLALTHPRYHLPKTYQVLLQGNPPESTLQQWRQGIDLSGKRTLPAQVKVLQSQGNKTLLEIVLTEGRNRQIRRVAEQLGFRVIALHRIAIGSIRLENPHQSALPKGKYRFLQAPELKFLQNHIHLALSPIPADSKENLL